VDRKARRDDNLELPYEAIDSVDTDVEEFAGDGGEQTYDRKYSNARRRTLLLGLLSQNRCTRRDIFERLRDYYNVAEDDPSDGRSSLQSARQMLKRDIQDLGKRGYRVEQRGRGDTTTYQVVKGLGPSSPFLFDQQELDALILLHTLFADPAKYAQPDPTLPLPEQAPRNPFAEDILTLIERLVETLTPQQKKEFDRWTRKPYVYLNLDTITDYLPHRATIDKIIQAIAKRQQISFEYAALHRRQESKLHEHVDPYYITREDGHLYLIGYSHDPYNSYMNRFFEFRIDRIKGESLKPGRNPISREQQRKPIEFSYWIDSSLAERGLSNRWLAQTTGPERETFIEDGREVERVLVRAKAYSEFRIMQQLHKYGDKVELVEPASLREKMGKEIERLYRRYHGNK